MNRDRSVLVFAIVLFVVCIVADGRCTLDIDGHRYGFAADRSSGCGR